MQSGIADCGVFAIAYATAVVYNDQPSELCFNQSRMKTHLMECLEAGRISVFPIKKNRSSASKAKPSEHLKVYCIC